MSYKQVTDMAKKTKRFNKGKMARGLVYFCITVLTIVLIWAMIVKSITISYVADLSDVLTFAAAVFGGELLLLLLKRIFAKPSDNNNDDYDSMCGGGLG